MLKKTFAIALLLAVVADARPARAGGDRNSRQSGNGRSSRNGREQRNGREERNGNSDENRQDDKKEESAEENLLESMDPHVGLDRGRVVTQKKVTELQLIAGEGEDVTEKFVSWTSLEGHNYQSTSEFE